MKTRRAVAASTTGAARVKRGRKTTDATGPISASTTVSNEERHQLISRAAYLRAEQRNFAPGCELEDWLIAEAEIDSLTGNA